MTRFPVAGFHLKLCRMRRRDVIKIVVGAASAWPVAVLAQEPMRRVGVLSNIGESDPEAQSMAAALHQGLRELGWVAGRNLQIDHRWGAGSPERLAGFAKELVALKPDVIVAHTTPAVLALRRETDGIPMVFVQVSDPIGTGFISNMARPGGNVTGFTNFEATMVGKWVEMLKEMAPALTQVIFVYNPQTAPYVPRFYQAPLEQSARSLGVASLATAVHNPREVDAAIGAFAREGGGGLILMPDSFNIVHRDQLLALAMQHRLPNISPYRFAAEEGGLMSYGVEQIELFRQAASYVDRLLKGGKPAELPVQAPTKFELVINLKAAKALGLTVPLTLQARADQVVE